MKTVLGTFTVESGHIIISDPCYKKSVIKKGLSTTHEVPIGIWKASVTRGDRVSALIVEYADTGESCKWVKTGETVAVDSGQMSIFDEKFYLKVSEAKGRELAHYIKRDPFYAACCALTCGPNSESRDGGVLPHGAVSPSGYGDGVYEVYIKTLANGTIVGVKVSF